MISIFLASLSLAAAPGAVENSESQTTSVVQTVSNSYELGTDVVQKTRADYQAGKYSEFLNQMDKDYKNAKAENGLEGLIEIRKESGKISIHPEFARSNEILQKAKNQDLLNAVGNEDSPFAKKVRSAASSLSSESEALRSLYFKVPGDEGLTKDENTVIQIDLEYYYKNIHLDSTDSGFDKREKHVALEMEKMDRLLQASQSFEDSGLRKAVEASASNLDTRLAKSYDMRDLLALARGSIKPASSLETKAASIVANAQGQIAELHRHLLNSLDNAEPIAESVQQ